MPPRSTSSQEDHDLIIEIHTKVSRLIEDVKDLKDNATQRISNLEDNSIDREEFEKWTKVVTAHTTFIDNLKGKYSIIGVAVTALIAIVSSWLVKNS